MGNDTTVTVHVPISFIRRGGRKTVVYPASSQQSPALSGKLLGATVSTVVHTLAHAFMWQQMLDEGTYATITELAAGEKLDPSFVSRVIRLTLLAPAVIEAIINGHNSDNLQRQNLLHGFSLDWEQQCGFIDG